MFEKIDTASQAVPVGVAGALVAGLPISDWILIGTAVLLVLNLSTAFRKFYKEVIKRGTK